MVILNGSLILGEWRSDRRGRAGGGLLAPSRRGERSEVTLAGKEWGGAAQLEDTAALRPRRHGGGIGKISSSLGGELKGRDRGWRVPPERRVIGPTGGSVGEEELWRLWDDMRRGRRVSSRSLIVRMWWDLDTAFPGEERRGVKSRIMKKYEYIYHC